MRLYLPTVFTVCALLSALSLNLFAQETSSFGPEVSAEDYSQHVISLSALNTNTERNNYITKQFNRLGLNGQNLACQSSEQGIYATLKNSTNTGTTTQYIAHLEDIYQTASVLEIAERFMTQKPRPSHDIRFNFFTSTQDNFVSCAKFDTSDLTIEPTGMEKLDSSSLVRYLNVLYVEGK
jgi:hypothetical protein